METNNERIKLAGSDDHPRAQRILPFGVALLVFLTVFALNPSLEAISTSDTSSYLQVAADLTNANVLRRPPAYPFVVAVAQRIAQERWSSLVVLLQMVALSGVAAILITVTQSFRLPAY